MKQDVFVNGWQSIDKAKMWQSLLVLRFDPTPEACDISEV